MSEETPSPRLQRLRAIAYNADFDDAFAHLSLIDLQRICTLRLMEAGDWRGAANAAAKPMPYLHPRLAPIDAAAPPAAPAPSPAPEPPPRPAHSPDPAPRGDDPPTPAERVARHAEAAVNTVYAREAERLGHDGTLVRAARELDGDIPSTLIDRYLRELPPALVAAIEAAEPGGPYAEGWRDPSWVDIHIGADIDAVMGDLAALRATGRPREAAEDADPSPTTPEPDRADAPRFASEADRIAFELARDAEQRRTARDRP